jgi:hypothetical protein
MGRRVSHESARRRPEAATHDKVGALQLVQRRVLLQQIVLFLGRDWLVIAISALPLLPITCCCHFCHWSSCC